MTKDSKLKVIAVGNDLYGDDGVGIAVLKVLEQIPDMKDVELIDGATDALGLIDHFLGVKHIIIVDAAQMGEKPGTVKVFNREEIKFKIKMDHLSVHGISLAETFDIAQMVDSLPDKITIIGIEPQNINISQNLSDVVKQSIPEVISNVINLTQINNSLSGENYA